MPPGVEHAQLDQIAKDKAEADHRLDASGR